MFKSTVLALAMLASAKAAYEGAPLKYNVYGAEGGCEESNIMYTGETTKLFAYEDEFEENALCETDILNGPNGTTTTIYTKFHRVLCKDDFAEIEAYNCFDEDCRNCSNTAEMDAVVTTDNVAELFAEPDACLTFLNATVNASASEGYVNLATMSGQAFLNSTDKKDAEEYWSYFFESECGEDWTETVKGSDAPSKFGTILASVLAIAAAVAV